uniref:Uncharacterized protein n=1 Tax=Siphoviridae sp. ctRCE13 TaxID=2826332 RepID=A0A8S5QQK4_9CAUD|nr:MAG TPA: hypothetical protein [Siphoviridae sp. ctRCE13]
MNEEEKKAIDFLKETNFDYLEYDMCISSVEIISNLVERLQKENEELKNQKATQRKINELLVQRYSNSISVQKVKDNLIKYQEEYELLLEHQSGKESNRTKYLRGRIHMCQELLEGRK